MVYWHLTGMSHSDVTLQWTRNRPLLSTQPRPADTSKWMGPCYLRHEKESDVNAGLFTHTSYLSVDTNNHNTWVECKYRLSTCRQTRSRCSLTLQYLRNCFFCTVVYRFDINCTENRKTSSCSPLGDERGQKTVWMFKSMYVAWFIR